MKKLWQCKYPGGASKLIMDVLSDGEVCIKADLVDIFRENGYTLGTLNLRLDELLASSHIYRIAHGKYWAPRRRMAA